MVKLVSGSLRGIGTTASNVQNLAGTIAPGAPDKARATGIIRISGNYTLGARRLAPSSTRSR